MNIKYISVFVFLISIISLCLFYFYINSGDKDLKNSGIVEIKTNLKNYKIIPVDKGGIKSPCLEILECEK
jgi:hypothetical protein|tara:strand:- start:701 stop:910 length:210 start_codon:yes stop_codon:yes gene_type:complete